MKSYVYLVIKITNDGFSIKNTRKLTQTRNTSTQKQRFCLKYSQIHPLFSISLRHYSKVTNHSSEPIAIIAEQRQ